MSDFSKRKSERVMYIRVVLSLRRLVFISLVLGFSFPTHLLSLSRSVVGTGFATLGLTASFA